MDPLIATALTGFGMPALTTVNADEAAVVELSVSL